MTSQNGDFTMMASVGTASCTALLADLCSLKSLPHALVHLFCLLLWESATLEHRSFPLQILQQGHIDWLQCTCTYNNCDSHHCQPRTTHSQLHVCYFQWRFYWGWGWEVNQGGSRQSTELKPFTLSRCGLLPITTSTPWGLGRIFEKASEGRGQ